MTLGKGILPKKVFIFIAEVRGERDKILVKYFLIQLRRKCAEFITFSQKTYSFSKETLFLNNRNLMINLISCQFFLSTLVYA